MIHSRILLWENSGPKEPYFEVRTHTSALPYRHHMMVVRLNEKSCHLKKRRTAYFISVSMQIMSDDVYFKISGSVNVFVLFMHDHVEQVLS